MIIFLLCHNQTNHPAQNWQINCKNYFIQNSKEIIFCEIFLQHINRWNGTQLAKLLQSFVAHKSALFTMCVPYLYVEFHLHFSINFLIL
jgi:hypothetical protein